MAATMGTLCPPWGPFWPNMSPNGAPWHPMAPSWSLLGPFLITFGAIWYPFWLFWVVFWTHFASNFRDSFEPRRSFMSREYHKIHVACLNACTFIFNKNKIRVAHLERTKYTVIVIPPGVPPAQTVGTPARVGGLVGKVSDTPAIMSSGVWSQTAGEHSTCNVLRKVDSDSGRTFLQKRNVLRTVDSDSGRTFHL